MGAKHCELWILKFEFAAATVLSIRSGGLSGARENGRQLLSLSMKRLGVVDADTIEGKQNLEPILRLIRLLFRNPDLRYEIGFGSGLASCAVIRPYRYRRPHQLLSHNITALCLRESLNKPDDVHREFLRPLLELFLLCEPR